MIDLTRRNFLKTTVLSSLYIPLSLYGAQSEGANSNKVIIFSKHLQNLNWDDLAIACKDCGLDGVDLTVRDGGHVVPERAEVDLPKVVEIFNKHNLEVVILTTRLLAPESPYAENIIKTAGQLKIPYIRIGYHQYNEKTDITEQITQVKKDLEGLTRLAEKYNVTLGYHNHSGLNNVGGPIWDLVSIFKEINSPHLGSNFDLGHVKAEGFGGAWKAHTLSMLPWIRMVAVKDFIVENHKVIWVPLGKGCVPVKEMLDIIIKKGNFKGPISIHMEYKTSSESDKMNYIKTSTEIIRKFIQ